jgi:LL-diaminopimelate aminotransferase
MDLARQAFRNQNPSALPFVDLSLNTIRNPLPPKYVGLLQARISELTRRINDPFEAAYGYPPASGRRPLREEIARQHGPHVKYESVFVTEGSQTALFKLAAFISGTADTVAVQTPAYTAFPAALRRLGYVAPERGRAVRGQPTLVPLLTTRGTAHQPRVPSRRVDAIYLMSPGNPTGVALKDKTINGFIEFAMANEALLIVDTAYASFQSPDASFSIFSYPGATECVIEVGTLSKIAALAAIRIGWAVLPSHRSEVFSRHRLDQWGTFLADSNIGVSIISQMAAEVFFEGHCDYDFQ